MHFYNLAKKFYAGCPSCHNSLHLSGLGTGIKKHRNVPLMVRLKQMKYNYLLKYTQADVIIIQETKLIQSQKTPNISYFTSIRTDRNHKQGRVLLTYIENNISFSQLNTSNNFPIELQIIKIHLSITAIIYCKHLHST